MTRKKMHLAAMAALLVAWLGAAAPNAAAEVLRPSELNKNREKYDGQVVVVDGILLIQMPHNNHLKLIYDSRLRMNWVDLKSKLGYTYGEKHPDKGCVSLDNPEIFDNINKPRYRRVRVKGEFIAHYESAYDYISGTCAIGTGIWITEILEVH